MSLDVHHMAHQVEHDLRDQRLRSAVIDESGTSRQAHRHPLLVAVGRELNRLGNALQGIPAATAIDLRTAGEPKHAAR